MMVRVVFFSFWAVIFFLCVPYDITIILCCVLGFRASITREND